MVRPGSVAETVPLGSGRAAEGRHGVRASDRAVSIGPNDGEAPGAYPRVMDIPERAEILETGVPDLVQARIVISAPTSRVFALIADPRRHAEFDGSGTVRRTVSGPERLALGARFGVAMRMGIPYRVTNTVIEFEEGRRIAWRHLARNVWRYELVDLGDGRTEVTETADFRPAIHLPIIRALGAVRGGRIAIAKTLVRLKRLAEGGASGT